MNDPINTWNIREYVKKGQFPEFIYKRNDMRQNIAAWASLCGNGSLLGPYIFSRKFNDCSYLQMIKNFAFSQW